MDARAAGFPYPWQRRKILHLVRHGQAMHNAEAEKSLESLLSPNLFDAQLTPRGLQQAADLRKDVHASGLLDRIELVITSPLSRAMETAVKVFGNGGHNSPPVMAIELCRDRLGLRPCDKRRTISACKSRFPRVDFTMMEWEEDNLWDPNYRERVEELVERAELFLKWLWDRPETEIVVVSHGLVLQKIQSILENDYDNPCKRFDHCELRSVDMIVDKRLMSMKGSPTRLRFDWQGDVRVIKARGAGAVSNLNGLADLQYILIDNRSRVLGFFDLFHESTFVYIFFLF